MTSFRRGHRFLSLFVVVLAVAAAPARADKCTGAKLKATGKAGAGALKCESQGDGKGLDVATIDGCEVKPDGKLAGAFTKADGKVTGGCPGVAGDVATAIDNCENATNTAVMNAGDPRTVSKCDGKIVAAMAKKLSGLLGCDSKEAAGKGDQTVCRTGVSAKFSAAMGKLSAATDCSAGVPNEPAPPAAAGPLETVIETCRTNIDDALGFNTTTTTTTATTTTT